MAKHISKVPPAVRSLVAWQEAQALVVMLRKAGQASADVQQLSLRILEVIERGHALGDRSAEITSVWESLAILAAIREKTPVSETVVLEHIERAQRDDIVAQGLWGRSDSSSVLNRVD